MTPRCFTRLAEGHADLQRVVLCADEAGAEFFVSECLRSAARQKKLFDEGKSKKMNSRHLTGHAVDLACWFDRDADRIVDADEVSWKFEYYLELAERMKESAIECNIPVRWGGSWTVLNDTPNLKAAVDEYVVRCKRENTKPLVDGPHFELPRDKYP